MNKHVKSSIGAFVFSMFAVCVMDALYFGFENVQWLMNGIIGVVVTVLITAFRMITGK